jgi:hypothetical protein
VAAVPKKPTQSDSSSLLKYCPPFAVNESEADIGENEEAARGMDGFSADKSKGSENLSGKITFYQRES